MLNKTVENIAITKVSPKVTLLTHTEDSDGLVAFASRICYTGHTVSELRNRGLSEAEIRKGIEILQTNGHDSPFEHISFTFGVEGVSRSLLAQITRHRIGCSFSVQSQRYVKLSDYRYITPKEISEDDEINELFEEQIKRAVEGYNAIADKLEKKYKVGGMSEKEAEKKAIENARAILPNASNTQMIITMNARALMHFFEERCCNRAQEEIRELAWSMLKLVKEVAPLTFAKAGPKCVKGECPEKTMSCGKPYTYSKTKSEEEKKSKS